MVIIFSDYAACKIVHVVDKEREGESVGDQDPPSDHWPPSDSPPTHPVLFAPLTSSEAEIHGNKGNLWLETSWIWN